MGNAEVGYTTSAVKRKMQSLVEEGSQYKHFESGAVKSS